MKKLIIAFSLLLHMSLLPFEFDQDCACVVMPDTMQEMQESIFTRIQRANRRYNAKSMRVTTAQNQAMRPLGPQPTNGDEERYADKRGSFGKSLAHLDSGFLDVAAFDEMVQALQCGIPANFLDITMGTDPVQRRLVDPQAAFTYNFDGADGWVFSMKPAPALASAEAAGEMVEVYWQALARDVPFNQYGTNPTTNAAIADLNNLSDFKGPKINGLVTPQTLFRGNTRGDLIGPFISQFLYLPVPYGPGPNYDEGPTGTPGIDFQAQIVPTSSPAENDFMTTFNEWLFIQRGNNPTRSITYTNDRIFIRDGRDLGDYVHQDTPQQPYVNAALILLGYGALALDQANPYLNNPTQEAFVTYGVTDILYLVCTVAQMALRAAWYQKWRVHRRLRPEYFAFLVNQQVTGQFDSGLNSDIINSAALPAVFAHNAALPSNAGVGTYFLPMAYPEGSPTHPAYPAGHATVAGACATILKAFFNEEFVIANALEPNGTNTQLDPYAGQPLTVGNELNKLASNISLGRDDAGVHYRSDGRDGMKLGEEVAIALMQDESFSRNINFSGYSLTKFDGTTITIGEKKVAPHIGICT